jgi:RNA polymerase sigma factor (sigma-70 family)
MSHAATGSVVRQLGALFEGGSAAGLSDGQLLERYTSGGHDPAGQAAFAALVGRHGPMVLGVCRQLLGDAQHAEDAFQATFLVLAQKARSIRDPELLGNWLYGVATRTARCARQQVARRRRREEDHAMRGPGAGSCALAEPTAPPADRPAIDREQAEALHGEVDRLPKAFRLPVVLCYFEGLTLDEAAKRLRCPAGTVRSRLARARDKLRTGLARRGVVLPAAAVGTLLLPRSASASVPPLLCETTTRAAIAFAARHAAAGGALSAPVVALAQEVLNTMLIHTLRLVVMTVLALAGVATGAGYLALALAGSREGEPPGEPGAQTARQEPRPPADEPRATGQRMTVAGRVLDPDGKPVQGAVVDVVAWPRVPFTGASEEFDPSILLGRGKSDGDGRYRLDAPRTASTRIQQVFALAAAPGYGVGLVELNPDADQPGAELKLLPEQPIRLRLVDVTGAPARGAEIAVLSIGRPGHGQLDGIILWTNLPEGIRTWPRPVKTDDQGRATVPGIGRGLSVLLVVRDHRYAQQHLHIETGQPTAEKETTHALRPAKIIEGRVLAGDTGQPIPNAVISIAASEQEFGSMFSTRFRADGQGRYTANPSPGEYFRVYAYAPPGQPYLAPEVAFAWTKGTVKKALDIRAPRGVVIRGKVTEQGTGRPLPASSIQFIPAGAKFGDNALSGWQAMVASREDGSFQVAVPPGKGHLLVFGPTGDHVAEEIGYNMLLRGRPGGMRYRAHAIIAYNLNAGDPPREMAAALRPGATIRGRIEGPDGQTITDASLITTLRVEATNPFWRADNPVKVRDGRFELHGVDPEGSSRISILDPEHEWGATTEVSGRQAGEDFTIRLQPCGKASAQFVGPDGKPIAKHQPMFELVATPGPTRYSGNEKDRAALSADTEMVANIDRKHYWNSPLTDAEGRVTLPALIPGALYRISDFSTVNDRAKGMQIRKEFTVKPGQTLDLGDILIEKPGG